ncbi:MAG: hypothetical protein ACRD5H_06020, partial [Nitrososphaerales archaeon]
SKSLVLLNLSHQLPVAIVANTVQALNTHDYQYFLGIMRKLITTSDFQRVFETLSSLEFAINLARITRRDDLTKLKLEHMQLEFMRIKGVAAKLRHNPESNALREELIRLLSIMEEKLLASSETHEILLSLGTDENQLFDDFRIVTKENGSREMTWKRL